MPKYDVKGKVIKDNHQYYLEDNTELDKLTVSKTYLKPHQCTNGHKHADIDEVYIFVEGRGILTIGDRNHVVEEGVVKYIPQGLFHKVNNTEERALIFLSVFNPYKRS